MGTTLQHGIFLPAEGERNCYTGLASNWTILDGVVGGYGSHAANLTIHVTAADKEAWNGKADASALTAHTGDTTIHVTAADKEAWNGKQDALSQTQLDAVNSGIDSTKVQQIVTNTSDISSLQSGKANDSDVVHKSGNETISGNKTFANTIKSQKEIELTGNRLAYILPGFSASYSGLNLCTYSSSGAVRIGTWKVDDNDNTKHVLDASLGYLNISTGAVNSVNIVYLAPRNSTDSKLGDSTNKWKEINGLTPSSLGMPDLNNGVDISGYITNLAGSPNIYNPPANGYIVLRSTNANVLGIVENTTAMGSYSRGSNQELAVNLPVVKNSSISIYAICSSLTQAKFIPCLGNI